MFQPLFREGAPACCNLAANSRALAMCHEPAREEKNTDAGDATHTNQLKSDMNILWKSFDLSSNDTAFVMKYRSRAEF
jgi:hypothetical protein